MNSIATACGAALIRVVVLVVGMGNAEGEEDAAEGNKVEPERGKQGVHGSVDLA